MNETRTRFQKIVLVLLASMAVLFAVLIAVSQTRKGVYFEETLLRVAEDGDRTVYTGRAHGREVSISVTWPTNFRAEVEFFIQGVLDDVCVMEYPTDHIQTELGTTVNGIRIIKNGALLFEGGYDPDADSSWISWFSPTGELDARQAIAVRGVSSDFWQGYEIFASHVTRFAFGPELQARGSWAMYFLLLLGTFFVALDVAFPMSLFYLRHCCDVRNPEPSDFYLACQRAGWVLLPLLLFGGYCYALYMIP